MFACYMFACNVFRFSVGQEYRSRLLLNKTFIKNCDTEVKRKRWKAEKTLTHKIELYCCNIPDCDIITVLNVSCLFNPHEMCPSLQVPGHLPSSCPAAGGRLHPPGPRRTGQSGDHRDWTQEENPPLGQSHSEDRGSTSQSESRDGSLTWPLSVCDRRLLIGPRKWRCVSPSVPGTCSLWRVQEQFGSEPRRHVDKLRTQRQQSFGEAGSQTSNRLQPPQDCARTLLSISRPCTAPPQETLPGLHLFYCVRGFALRGHPPTQQHVHLWSQRQVDHAH